MPTFVHKPRNVMVTGGMGFIGTNFVKYLLETDPDIEHIVAYDLLTYAAHPMNIRELEACGDKRFILVQGDVRDEKKVLQAITKYNIDTVVHMAAESHVDRAIDDPSVFLTTNVNGTYSVLQAARTAWKKTPEGFFGKRFHSVSTDEVFGATDIESRELTTEDSPYSPNNPYSASKAAADHLCMAWFKTYGLPVTVSHCSNNYGPYQFPEKLIPLIVVRALEGKPLPVYGDGRNVRDWIHVRDHCSAISVILRKGVPGESYNIGVMNEQSNINLVKTICEILGRIQPRPGGEKYDALIMMVQDRPAHDRRYAIDPRKLERELGWKGSEGKTFEAGLEKTIRWYAEHKEWIKCASESSAYHCERLGLSK